MKDNNTMKKALMVCLLAAASAVHAGQYIWYPGQLAAYGQKYQRLLSAQRCVNVGYPGRVNQPVEESWFRHGSVLHHVTAQDRLPALFVDNPEGWEASLDGKVWTLAETDAMYSTEGRLPDEEWERTVDLKPMEIKNYPQEHGSVYVIDFKELEVGTVSLTATGKGELLCQVGESVEEMLSTDTTRFEQRPIQPVKLNGTQQIELPERALRYLAVFYEGETQLSDIVFHTRMWPVEQKMTFECDDEQLNSLFEASVKTLHTSMHRFYLDGVKRDYLPWAMDATVSQLAGDYVFADRQTARNGISIALMPPHPSVEDWGIIDYPLHALIGLKHDYLCYGDLSTLRMYEDRIWQQVKFYEEQQDARGFLVTIPNTSGFIPGWSRNQGPDKNGAAAYPQMMLYENFRIASYFARLLNNKKLSKYYDRKATQLADSIIAHFWDEDQKAFVNGYKSNGQLDKRISHHAQYWAVLTGLFPIQHLDNLFTHVIPSMDYYRRNISYEKGYEALAYTKAGHTKDFYDLMAQVWGDWLQQGNTRFPENFSYGSSRARQLSFYNRPYGLSLCHGANGAPVVLMALHGIIGFSQNEEHINEYTLHPNLLHLGYVKATIPIAQGTIEVEIQRQGRSSITIPSGCTVKVGKKKFSRSGTYTF